MTEHTTRHDRPNRDDEQDADRYRPTLGDCAHTNPRTDESFGDAMVYRRGPTVVADGGEAGARPPDEVEETDADHDDAEDEDERLADVDHTPPRDAEDANRVYERGGEADPDV